MAKLLLCCFYCNHKWDKETFGWLDPKDVICPVCGDTNVQAKQEDPKTDVYGYNSIEPQEDAYFRKRK